MKLTKILLQQHVGRMFREHWKVQRKKVVYENGSLTALKNKGLEYEDAVDFINKKYKPEIKIEKGPIPLEDIFKKMPLIYDESHPDYNQEKCFTYSDHNVLLEGIKQAQALTNTLVLGPETLSLKAEALKDEMTINKLIRRCIRSSLLFDAWQEKLPKRKDPLREAWNFSRDYGITDRRRNCLLVRRLLQLCSSFSPQLLGQHVVLNSANFKVPYTLDTGERLLFSVRGDAVILSNHSPAIKILSDLPADTIPDLYPLTPLVSLEPTNIYKFEQHFPVNEESKLNKIHTVVVHYNETEVSNIYETPVTNDQIIGRTLLHSWVYAMSQAQAQKEKNLKEPVTVQIIQTDGKFFHFGVMKLNSTKLNSQPNLFWSFPLMNLFTTCKYEDGIPQLEDYNPDVFRTLLSFYNS